MSTTLEIYPRDARKGDRINGTSLVVSSIHTDRETTDCRLAFTNGSYSLFDGNARVLVNRHGY